MSSIGREVSGSMCERISGGGFGASPIIVQGLEVARVCDNVPIARYDCLLSYEKKKKRRKVSLKCLTWAC